MNISKLKEDIVFTKELNGEPSTFHSTWGLFSPEKIDEGTELLIKSVSPKSTDNCLDIGCGYGAIGLTLAKAVPAGSVHLIDKDFVAIEYAKKNASLNHIKNSSIYLSNGFSNVPDTQFDVIVSNLPAKVSKELYWILFQDAKDHLKPGGTLTVVTVSGIREFVKRNFKEIFGNYEKVAQSKTYTVASTVKE